MRQLVKLVLEDVVDPFVRTDPAGAGPQAGGFQAPWREAFGLRIPRQLC